IRPPPELPAPVASVVPLAVARLEKPGGRTMRSRVPRSTPLRPVHRQYGRRRSDGDAHRLSQAPALGRPSATILRVYR
ncbi:hypothetical protein EXIGLDRAFT_724868, partial [Exidia glandulosa HHB12029]